MACAESMLAALDEVVDAQPVYASPADKRAAVVALEKVARRVAELRLRVVAECGEVADADAARDVAGWLAFQTQADVGASRAEAHLAVAVASRWQRVQAGMASGAVSLEQARVMVAGLEALPTHVGLDVIARAEEHLVGLAAVHRPAELRRIVRHLLHVVAPEIAEAEEARRLEEEERSAWEKTRFSYRNLGDGTSRGRIVIPEALMARLLTYLEAFASPRKSADALGGEEDRIPHSRKLGQAFCGLLEHLDPRQLPVHGGDATTVMVTVSVESLTADLATGGLIDADLSAGDNLSASAIRRLACSARIIPVVLGGEGEILDLGRSKRLYSRAQHKAMRLRDQRCRAEGCTIPATWCEAHHLKPWSEGGKTDLGDGVLACVWHHHRFHDRRFSYEILSNGDIRFHRRR
ncbi:HNH endonuclease signature motif containing protein [Nocardioides stalactiti]|uniref:HNH endonuclease signature motif containing protein n=1 Tax=Nocardioides stalactiti TaxID=2755356 RepID=UPI0028A804BA|nr:DUF222 domain-containing protein [Nocardioides stalactiti]